ncbi:MAG: DUF501 domain-containing protein [Gaiellaceae bacterium]
MDEREIVAIQIGRRPRALRRIAVRCPGGMPAVSEQAPYDERGQPFPTGYYLTCPQLVAAVSRLEAAGGVERWTAAVRSDARLRESLERANEEQRRLRERLAGDGRNADGGATLRLEIGGGRGGGLKCLHAHVAFALARPGCELGDRILAEIEPRWPGRCCMADRLGG